MLTVTGAGVGVGVTEGVGVGDGVAVGVGVGVGVTVGVGVGVGVAVGVGVGDGVAVGVGVGDGVAVGVGVGPNTDTDPLVHVTPVIADPWSSHRPLVNGGVDPGRSTKLMALFIPPVPGNT